MNTFGNIYWLTSFGESHGPGIGGVIDGCPAGIELDTAFIQSELNRRKPGQSKITTPRKEEDEVQFLSGIYEGKTTGTPIGFIIWNKNHHSADYDKMKSVYRPSHADYTYQTKYGIRDPRGGGRSSAREAIARCVAGAIAKLALRQKGIRIQAFTSQVGYIKLNGSYTENDLNKAEDTAVRCPDPATAEEMEALIAEVKSKGDTIGGGITKNTTAKITSQHGLIYDKLIRKFGAGQAKQYLGAHAAALQKSRELCRGMDCDFEE